MRRTLAVIRQRDLRRLRILREFRFVFDEIELNWPIRAQFFCADRSHHRGRCLSFDHHVGMPQGVCAVADEYQRQLKLCLEQRARFAFAREFALETALSNA
jgi:hypothetical protein